MKALEAKGVKAAAFPSDASDAAAVRKLIGDVRGKLGPVTVLHWNAYAAEAGDLLTADTAALHRMFDVAVVSLISAVQESLPDMKKDKEQAAVLVTNGGFGLVDPKMDAFAAQVNAMGISVASGPKHKLVGLLAEKLRPEGIYVGEVMVLGMVKGTAWDSGSATLEAGTIANKFWELYKGRGEVRGQVV
ncbi:MAG TPA: SDR family NAD(P)-dependent oxidoreductase [Polyangiaceae bacterium]